MAGSITRHPNGSYRPRYRDADGKQHERHFKTRAEAQAWLDQQTAAMVTGTHVDPRAGRQTFREYAEGWRAIQHHRPTTQAYVETMLRRHVYPTLGDQALGAIRPSHVQAWSRGRGDALAPSTATVVHRIVSGIVRAAVRDRLIASSPAEGVRPPKRHKQRVTPLPVEAVHALAGAVQDRWRAAVLLAAGTGMRQGEVSGLTVDRIDWLRRTVTVDRQLITVPGKPPHLAPPKTEASVRTIPLPQVVVDALAAHLAAYPAGPDGFVFTTAAGTPMRRTAFSAQVWRPAVRAAGLPVDTVFHSLRHHYASLLIRYGESVKTVQARLGHASAAETLDTYSHLWPDSDDRTREAVDSALGAPADAAADGPPVGRLRATSTPAR
ncbi:tyrosine-type recombinase/integrase [Geodermatophilus sp. SYSU D00079]